MCSVGPRSKAAGQLFTQHDFVGSLVQGQCLGLKSGPSQQDLQDQLPDVPRLLETDTGAL